MTAIGGILGANLLAIIGTQFFVPENKGVYVQPWSHAGWYIGTLLFFFGAVTGRLHFINGSGLGRAVQHRLQQNRRTEMKERPSLRNLDITRSQAVLRGSSLLVGWQEGFSAFSLGRIYSPSGFHWHTARLLRSRLCRLSKSFMNGSPVRFSRGPPCGAVSRYRFIFA